VTFTEAVTILQVARRHGVALPAGCNFGLCATCKQHKLSGEVHIVHNGGIMEDEAADGYLWPVACLRPICRIEEDA
jgi:stachydrine N-demethylase, reductase component